MAEIFNQSEQLSKSIKKKNRLIFKSRIVACQRTPFGVVL